MPLIPTNLAIAVSPLFSHHSSFPRSNMPIAIFVHITMNLISLLPCLSNGYQTQVVYDFIITGTLGPSPAHFISLQPIYSVALLGHAAQLLSTL